MFLRTEIEGADRGVKSMSQGLIEGRFRKASLVKVRCPGRIERHIRV